MNSINTQQAKKIDIVAYLARQGYSPVKTLNGQLWYKSPFRSGESKASFVVNPQRNIWIDFGMGNQGGSIIDLVLHLHGYHSITQALEHLGDFSTLPLQSQVSYSHQNLFDQTKNSIQISTVLPLKHHVLLKYLQEQRGISATIAQKYLHCAFYENAGKKDLYAIAWKMDSGGYELRSALFKACSARKDISTIKMSEAPYLYIFEGMLDFLSALEYKKQSAFAGTAIILNTTALVKKAIVLIQQKKWHHIFTFFDNDTAGKKASEKLIEACNEHPIKSVNFYQSFEDVNAFWCHQKGITQ